MGVDSEYRKTRYRETFRREGKIREEVESDMPINTKSENGIQEMAGYAEYLDLIEAAIQNKG